MHLDPVGGLARALRRLQQVALVADPDLRHGAGPDVLEHPIDLGTLQDRVRHAILDYEPRILPETLSVVAMSNEAHADHHNLIGFRITGQLWAQPVPLELMLQTDIDLETGRVEIRDTTR